MSADQFFYVIFSTFTNREVFGLLTYYYSEVLLYSAIFGASMLATSSFTINNCMMYRDACLVIVAMLVHMVYVFTQDQTVVWGSFGLYIVYLVMDWKNDALTHIGMKLFGKIKDDDSFEGDYPLNMKRKRIEIPSEQYEEIDIIIEENQERFDRNLNYHEIYTKLAIAKEIKDNRIGEMEDQSPLTAEELEVFDKRVFLRMKFAEAIYKHIFYLRYLIQKGLEARQLAYERNSDFPGLHGAGFQMHINANDFDNDRFEEQSAKSAKSIDDNLSISPPRKGSRTLR